MDFIYINNTSISREICSQIIATFEKEPNKYKGVTRRGLDISIKDTLDYFIGVDIDETSSWFDINSLLYNELTKNIIEFDKQILEKYGVHMFDKKLCDTGFMIQRYSKNVGKFVYHEDFSIKDNIHRIITYIWYLNDVNDGGETEFCGDFRIKPTAGKLVLFPASWCYPHCGLMPISDDKYIITGWLHII
ncbi:MAG: 2OG-Fe(II) oxygenase [Flavobacterium sp.]